MAIPICQYEVNKLIEKEKESGIADPISDREACKRVAGKLGVKVPTVRSWYQKANKPPDENTSSDGDGNKPRDNRPPFKEITVLNNINQKGDFLVFGCHINEDRKKFFIISQRRMNPDGKTAKQIGRLDIPATMAEAYLEKFDILVKWTPPPLKTKKSKPTPKSIAKEKAKKTSSKAKPPAPPANVELPATE